MSMSNYLENKVLNHICGNGEYTAPRKCYMALLTSSSTDETAGTEVVGAGYSRKSITFCTLCLSALGTFSIFSSKSKGNCTAIKFL